MDRFLSSGLCSGVEIAADGPGDQAATTGAMIMGSIAHFAAVGGQLTILWPSTFFSSGREAAGETPGIGPPKSSPRAISAGSGDNSRADLSRPDRI